MIPKSPPSPGDDSNETASSEYYVLGGGAVGASLAHYLRQQGRSVTLVDESHESPGVPSRQGDPADAGTLDAFEAAGHEPICATTALVERLEESL